MDTVILSSSDTGEFVECSSRHLKTTGTLFKKQIFRWGEFSHPADPNYKINVDLSFYETLKKNFDDGVVPIVQVPLVDDMNRHVEAPDRNIGEVVDLSADDEGVNAFIDFRKMADDVGVTLLGASAKFGLSYTDRRSNEDVGPTLIHVAITNRPFLVDLADFEIVSASDSADTEGEVILLTNVGNDSTETLSPPSKEENSMTKEEMIASLSADYGIDVEKGMTALAQVEGYVALSDVIGEGFVATPENLSQTIVDLTNSISERDTTIQELTAQIQTVQLSTAEAEVDDMISKGRIFPKNRDDMIELSMNDHERFERFLLPEELAKAELSEQGFTTTASTQEEDPAARAKARGQELANLTK